MQNALSELSKHLRIYTLFLKFSLMSQMEYRFNFIGNLSMEAGYLLVKLSYVVVVYRSNVHINGLSPDEILLFIGTFVGLTAPYAGMFMINNFRLREQIRDGNLDLYLTKPISVQFMITLRTADLTLFAVDFLAGGAMVAVAWVRLGIPLTVYTLGGYILFLLLSSAVAYSLFFLPQILTFWMTNTSAIAEITDSFWDFNNMPMDIYYSWIKQVGVFLLPIFVITNFPPMFLLGKLPPLYMVWAFLLPLGLLWLVRLALGRGLRAYSSASS